MSRIATAYRGLICAGLLALAAACSTIDRNHGYVPPDRDLDQIIIGVDTRATVEDVVGRPSAAGVLDAGGWYYVKSKFSAYGFRQPREVDREVVAISFDSGGVVSNIERFGLENGRVIVLSRRVTDSNIKGVTFLQQLFGGFGNFTADTLLGN